MSDSEVPEARTPVTILAGFLGSGKTTLLNRILAGSHGLRLTVFVNDFGSIDIDGRLLVKRDATTITLDNGCVCCSVSNDLVSQLLDVLEGQDRPERVLVETSGVSDPGRLLLALKNPHLRRLARIDGVITLVDAATADEIPPEHRELARRQLATADVIVFNKADLVDPAELASLRERLSYPAARVLESSFGDVPLEVVLGVGGHGDRGAESEPVPTDHHHGEAFATWAWTCDTPLAYEDLRSVLASLPPEVFRVKGFLDLAEAPGQRVVAHVVGRRVDIRPDGWWEGAPRSELVFVGLAPRLDTPLLRRRLDGAVVMPTCSESAHRLATA